MGRKILAVIVAFITGTAIMIIVEMINSLQLAPPSSEIMKDHAKLAEYMANGPARAYIVVLIGYVLGSFAAGFVVTKISRQVSTAMILPIIVGALLELGMVANILMLPGQPIWFIVAGLLTFIPLSLLGHRFAR